jgi:hypothetical protein
VLLSDGTPRPPRPPGVPEAAEFDEFGRRWGVAVERIDDSSGRWRHFSVDGFLDEEAEYREGRKVASRRYGRDGQVRFETRYVGDGVPDGPWLRRFGDEDESPYADPRVREERGSHEAGQPVGRWTFHDADGALLRAVDRGRADDPAARADMTVLRGRGRKGPGSDEWRRRAAGLRGAGRVREAVVAAARALARDRDVAAFRGLLDELTVPLLPERAEALAREATEGEGQGGATGDRVSAILSALLGGGEPATLLRTLASSIEGESGASLDLVEAALLLDPERRMAHLTRALVRLELGDRDGALADADAIAPVSEEAATFLRDYVRVLFPAWTFWPAGHAPVAVLPDMPEAPAQPLSAVRGAIQVYASRLARLRAAIVEALDGAEPSWLPPPLGALLPQGPLALRRYTGTITDETEDGPEAVEVEVDETIEPTGASIPVLLRAARAHWAGLTWLCWSAGLDAVDLPEALRPPEAFPRALAEVLQRFFRMQDVLMTNGLRSLTAGVEGFEWEGLDIDLMPKHFAQMAMDEYVELRAVFLWLASPENLSPFQNDLRQA